MTDFSRVLIVNRGEPATRLIAGVEEFAAERGTDMQTIALYTEPDRASLFVRQASEAHPLGPATFVDASDGRLKSSYLDYSRLEDAIVATRADAVWVGWGFVAEHAEFADLCKRLGVVFIGPPADVMRKLGDKITSKLLAEEAGVPMAPWSGGPVSTVQEALGYGEALGYPLMVKATAGGGGRGIRRVDDPGRMEEAFAGARSEALKAFGDDAVFLERLVPGARHIEVQIIGDDFATMWPVGVRDCSVQRRNQKLIEEAPSPVLNALQDREIRSAAARLGLHAGYRNAGTVEFLYDPDLQEFWFMEVNARLQVEHPITEMTTGVDMVKLQLTVAMGEPLPGELPATSGHAIEVRLNAEDPDTGFAPAPGRIDLFRTAAGPGIRVDTGFEEGDAVSAEFDSMIAKVVAHGRDRAEAIARLRRALRQTVVVIRNGATNKSFLSLLLDEEDFRNGTMDVNWVDRFVTSAQHRSDRHSDVALIAAAIAAYEEEISIERARFRASASRGRPEVAPGIGRTVELRYRGQPYPLQVFRLSPSEYRVQLDGASVVATVEAAGESRRNLRIGDATYKVLSVVHGMTHLVEVDGVPHRIAHDEGGIIRAPAPAVVVNMLVAAGDEVERGQRLAVIEAMKMETALLAEFPGRVREVLARANVQVAPGTPLLVMDPLEHPDGETGGRVTFAGLPVVHPRPVHHAKCRHRLDSLRRMFLGYDVDPAQFARPTAEPAVPCPDALEENELQRRENEILTIFVDLIGLFRRHPTDDEVEHEVRRSTEEYLFAYLRDPSGRGDSLPERFMERLRAALSHYGVKDLEPGDRLDAALYRIARSHDRMDRQIGSILGVLEQRLDRSDEASFAQLRPLLDRLILETRDRYPAVNDLAQEIHYALFDRPFLEEIRTRTYAEADDHIARLEANPLGPDRERHIAALVDCPQPLKSALASRFNHSTADMQEVLLEVITRRYYRIRDLDGFSAVRRNGHVFGEATYERDGTRIHLVATFVDLDHIEDALVEMGPLLDAVAPGDNAIVDIYAWRPSQVGTANATRDDVLAVLDRVLGRRQLRRIVVAVSSPQGGTGEGGVLHYTFRPAGDGAYREETQYRDLHPMMGKRLELWRLDNFDIRRLPSLEDVYLFLGVARENKRDERLFALAEVRDLTPIRSESGTVVRLPQLERMLKECLNAIRRIQAHRPADRRLSWNRVLLYIWPVLELGPEEMAGLVQRLAPDTEGLGLEKVAVRTRIRADDGSGTSETVFEISNPSGHDMHIRVRGTSTEPLRPLGAYEQKVAQLRQRGLVFPYELVKMLASPEEGASGIPPGDFVEYDLVDGVAVPVVREPGLNTANIVFGVVRNITARYPEGMRRVLLLGDPSRGMGNLAEPECARIIAGLDLAEELGVPLEWFAVSAGALISMQSGTENMDWISKVLRRIIEFTQAGGEVNVVVTGINVGAQPYWNAEATMLMHTSGVLIMTPESAMVLTGKQALDYSGGVSAEDNQGIGGYERIMGPNGQAQYFALDLADAASILLRYYEHTYVAPGERFPRRADTTDPEDRDVSDFPHGGEFAVVGDVFSDATNPGRKRPFEIRRIMAACVDQDLRPLERWFGMQDAEVAVVWDAHLGGHPVAMLGFESKPIARTGYIPADGPEQWTSGTLFPMASKKVARAINAASGRRPLVVLANLSGFDGSPESMRKWQLEYGAEIGRAVVNFDGPMVFCVVARYHGGAFVVFSAALNESLEVAALEGTHASVIGGAPAAAVVFSREVRKRTDADPRIAALQEQFSEAAPADKAKLGGELARLRDEVYSEKLGEVADEFDRIHSVERALEVGSVHRIVPPAQLRPYLIDAVQRGIRRALATGQRAE